VIIRIHNHGSQKNQKPISGISPQFSKVLKNQITGHKTTGSLFGYILKTSGSLMFLK
jgi:hypothetical protein